MTPKRHKLISWAICLLIPAVMMIYALITHPDGFYAAPLFYIGGVLSSILWPVFYVVPHLLWAASSIAVGVILYKAKQILVPGTAWEAAACAVVSGVIASIFLYDVVTLSYENGIRTRIASAIILLLPLAVYPLSASFVYGKGDEPKTAPIFAKTLLGVLTVALFLALGLTKETQTIFDERNAREMYQDAITLNESDDAERMAHVDKSLMHLIKKDQDRAPLRMWLMHEGLTAPNVSPFEDEVWILVPTVWGYGNIKVRCSRDGEGAVETSWGEDSMTEVTAALLHRMCVKRAAEF